MAFQVINKAASRNSGFGGRKGTSGTVRMDKSGRLFLAPDLSTDLVSTGFTHAKVLVDPDTKMGAILPIKTSESGAFKLTPVGKTTKVHCLSLGKKSGIEVFDWRTVSFDEENKWYTFSVEPPNQDSVLDSLNLDEQPEPVVSKPTTPAPTDEVSLD